MEAEARIVRRHAPVEIGGGAPEGAQAAAERLVARGVTGLVSFGLAGGLDPALAAGALVIPESVIDDGQVFAADIALSARFGGVMPLRALAAASVLASVAAKRAAWIATGAAIVDLESGAVARMAARHGLPFAVVRAVCDPTGRNLPLLALSALDAGGRIGVARVVGSLLRHPLQLPGLLGLARDAMRARASLDFQIRRFIASPRE